jgi:hypothetical protein
MGRYLAWHLNLSMINGEIVDKFTSYGSGVKQNTNLNINPELLTGGVGMELGKNSIFVDKFYLNLAIKLNVSASAILKESIDNNSSNLSNQQKFDYAIQDRISMHSFLMFKIGVGLIN